MSDALGGFMLGFGAVGLFYSVLHWASFKTLTASLIEMRRAVESAETVIRSMESEQSSHYDESDSWKFGYNGEEEEQSE